MRLALLILLAACRNDAITYAHIIDPTATCHQVDTHAPDGDGDTATCSSSGHTWFCFATKNVSMCIEGDRVVHSTMVQEAR